MDWILERLGEGSTWTGIASAVATLCGVVIAPDFAAAIAGVGVAVTSLALVVMKEKKA